jgi:hypothetical protein
VPAAINTSRGDNFDWNMVGAFDGAIVGAGCVVEDVRAALLFVHPLIVSRTSGNATAM